MIDNRPVGPDSTTTKITRRSADRAVIVAIAVAAFITAFLLNASSSIGLTTDSVHYHSAAATLVRDGTLEVPASDWERPDSLTPLKHYPPAVSLGLGAAIATGAEFRRASQLLNALSAAACMAMLALLLTRVLGWRPALSITAAIAILPDVVYVHQYLMSEPLYMAWLSATLALMVLRSASPLAYGMTAMAASMTRYLGLAIILAVCMWAFLQPNSRWRRVRSAFLAGLPSLLVQGTWQLRAMYAGERVLPIEYPGQWSAEAARMVGVLSRWAGPGIDAYIPRVAFGATIVAITVAFLWHNRRKLRARITSSVPLRLALMAVGMLIAWHLIVLVVLRAISHVIPFDRRMLAPVLLLVTLAIGIVLAAAWDGHRRFRWALAAALLGWAVFAVRDDVELARLARRDGLEYAARQRRNSPSIAWLRSEADSFAIFTNAHATAYFNAGRHVRPLPLQWTAAERDRFADTVRARRGLIAVFEYPASKVPPARKLISELPVRLVEQFDDAAFYVLVPAP